MTLRTLVVAALALAMQPYFGRAQLRNGYSSGGPIAPPGTIKIHSGFEGGMGTLDQQIRWSDAIVDGSVTAVLPSINLNPGIPGQVVTVSRVTVNSVLRGNVSAGTELLIIEFGGKQGQWNVIDPDNPLLQAGERYIFFLRGFIQQDLPNSVGVLPDSGAVPRFEVEGFQNGKARIDANGNIQFASGATQTMLPYNGMSSSSFVSMLNARIAHLFPPPPPYPAGVTPIPLPPNRITPLPANRN